MTYTDLLRDFSRRTLANVGRLQAEHDARGDAPVTEAPFIVTAYLGAFVGIFVLIRNSLNDLVREHPEALKELTQSLVALSVDKGDHMRTRDQVLAFRNAVGHGRISVLPNETGRIGTIGFSHRDGSWEATMSVAELRQALSFIERFIEAI